MHQDIPRTITIFLVSGSPNGIKKLEISNRTIRAYVVPRIRLADAKQFKDLCQPALYFLLNKDTATAYVGESENFYDRVKNHDQNKAFWEVAVAFIAKDKSLEKGDVKYLESLAVEALQKLLNDEVKARFATNAVKARSFSELLERALQRYKNNAITAAQVIEELIDLAHKMSDDIEEAQKLGLTQEEIAFYDALAANQSAREVMGDDQLRKLAAILVKRVRANVSVDWMVREDAQARLRVEVKRLLKEYGYPPDEQKLATDLVLEQATLYGDKWSTQQSDPLEDMGISVVD